MLIEAMACGTPVVAYRHGSVPEVVEHGVSGLIVDDFDGAVAAVGQIGALDRRAVRRTFERRFTAEVMARNYLRVYRGGSEALAKCTVRPRPALKRPSRRLLQTGIMTDEVATNVADPRSIAPAAEPPPPTPAITFYIPATSSLAERRPRTLKHGDTFGLFDHYGDLVAGEGSPEGIYHKDTRFLSSLQLLINDRRPLLLSSTVQDNNTVLTADLTNPDFFDRRHRLHLPRDTIHMLRSKFMWQAQTFERLGVRNFGERPHAVALTFTFERRFRRSVRGPRPAPGGARADRGAAGGAQAVVFTYHGLAGDVWQTTLEFGPPPRTCRSDRASLRADASAPGSGPSLFLTVRCDGEAEQAVGASALLHRHARRSPGAARSRTAGARRSRPRTRSSTRSPAARWPTSTMLITDTPHGPYPYAGIPWFSTAFGRDGIITAAQLLWLDPTIADGVLGFLAAHQATAHRPGGRRRAGQDPARDPARRDGSARRGAVRPLLRRGRQHAAVRDAGRHVFRAHRRSRPAARRSGRACRRRLRWIDE